MPVRKSTTKPRRGIYLLPNLFTTAALFAGYYAIVSAINGQFETAAISIFVAAILDGMDGRVARMTNTQSAFGAEYDSLSDMISFGLAPSLVMYLWTLSTLGKLGWMAAFIYSACGALRLARFNTQVDTADKRYFQGLPSPAAAGLVAGLVWVGEDFDLRLLVFTPWLCFIVTLCAGLFMVSRLRFHSFKELDLKGRVPFVYLLAIMLVFALISLNPPSVLLGILGCYALSGPVLTLMYIRQLRAERRTG